MLLPERLQEHLRKWLEENHIEMTPDQWYMHCLKKLGYVGNHDKITKERYRGEWNRPSKKYRKKK